jgi:hypothetical protein
MKLPILFIKDYLAEGGISDVANRRSRKLGLGFGNGGNELGLPTIDLLLPQ